MTMQSYRLSQISKLSDLLGGRSSISVPVAEYIHRNWVISEVLPSPSSLRQFVISSWPLPLRQRSSRQQSHGTLSFPGKTKNYSFLVWNMGIRNERDGRRCT